jgi:pseudouridylate synthase
VLVHPEIAEALSSGTPVVALESTIISHGLPRPQNLRIAREIEDEVRAGGAVPATVAVVDGVARIGLDDDALTRVASDPSVAKVSVRDLATVAARGGMGATTVASTAHLAARAGIAVFATGGLGGVHRGAVETWDESADLTTLSRTPVLVVCAGVKSILDVAATLERLETLNIGVLGYRTDRFPGFYLRDSGYRLDWRVDSPDEVAAVLRSRAELGTSNYGLVLANPVDPADELDHAVHDDVLARGLAAADQQAIRGKDVTPFLLDWFHRETGGASLATNVALVRSNARLAAEVAAAAVRG